jgi:D-serine deaminase-like pyridoxal phosphate-dependent protein
MFRRGKASLAVLTSDFLGLTGYGHIWDRDDIFIDQLSEEHGRPISSGPIGMSVGDKARVVPNHACMVTNMVDTAFCHWQWIGSAEAWSVTARGMVA